MRRRQVALVAAMMALGATGAHAAEASAEVDLELLEFLGSLDAEEEDWREYLAERPIRSEMGRPAGQAAGKPVPPTTAPGTSKKPAPEQDKVKKP